MVTGPRIGDKALGREADARAPSDARLTTRVAAAVASPLGVLILVPAIVLAIGAWLTFLGQSALESSSLALGVEQLRVRNATVGRQIGLALAAADPMLERLRTLASVRDSTSSLPALAFAMRDLMQGRSGVAYVSISYPDGTFQGTYVDEDGSIRFQDSRVTPGGTRVVRFATDGRRELTALREEHSNYDPRKRGFYDLALANPGPVWTNPYPFFKTHYPGVTRTEAVRGQGGDILAVLTVDFDVRELSRFLERIPLAGTRVVLFSDEDGTLLADPAAAEHMASLPITAERTLKVADVKDPVLDAFFAARGRGGASFSAGGRRYLAQQATVGDPALRWRVASFIPEDLLLGPARSYEGRARVVALLSLLVAVAVSFVFSRHIVRMRRQTADARAAATRAAAEARDLGSYRLTTRLGAGGMGEVWRAEHRLLARQAAIKLIRPEADAGPEAHERFRREAQTLATLRSRNTIELFDYGITEDGTFFYVMELLDGMDLETLVGRFGPQRPARVCSLLMQACNSLAEAHAAGLVHRDVKPANLYVCRVADEVDVLKVLDFGLVRSLAEVASPASTRSFEQLARELDSGVLPLVKLTAAGSVMGTPDYMAPEQVLGHDIDARADVYALGCVAYFALSGELPFSGHSDAMEIMLAHLDQDPAPLAERAKQKLPPKLVELVHHCMARRAEDRPASVSAVRRELAAIQFSPAEAWTDELAAEWWRLNVPRPLSLWPSAGPLSPRSNVA
ncbi:MAG TPA: serine/threonine protein kinase [Polyangiaceae bacterium]|nr:serine/threonine protein kinase [Polyangiaceae bacterium]